MGLELDDELEFEDESTTVDKLMAMRSRRIQEMNRQATVMGAKMGLELDDELEFEDESTIFTQSTSASQGSQSQSAEDEYEELADHFGNSLQFHSDSEPAEQKTMDTASHLTLDIFAGSSYFADEEAEIKNQMLSLNNLRVPTKSTSRFGRGRAQTAGSDESHQ